MRILKVIAPFALLATLALTDSSSAASHHKRPCAVPHGWSVVARDRQAVVIRQQSTYRYCSRLATRRYRRVPNFPAEGAPGAPAESVVALQLAGRYISYETKSDDGEAYALWLVNTRTGAQSYAAHFTYLMFPPAPEFVLSPNGVAAWIVYLAPSSHSAPEVNPFVEALTGAGAKTIGVGSSPQSILTNLALYDCAADCRPHATVVTWTDSGQRMYAGPLYP